MDALVGRDRSQTARQMLTAPGERRIVGGGEVEAHHPEQCVQEPFGLAQREMVKESQGQGGLDGEIRVAPLPTPPAAPAGRPASDRLRGQPHRHIAASNECAVVGRPVRNAVLRLVRGMDLRLHPCSVAPAESPEKCAPTQGLHATTPYTVAGSPGPDQDVDALSFSCLIRSISAICAAVSTGLLMITIPSAGCTNLSLGSAITLPHDAGIIRRIQGWNGGM